MDDEVRQNIQERTIRNINAYVTNEDFERQLIIQIRNRLVH